MIFLDRMMRYFNKDFQLPIRCYAELAKKINPCHSCKCRIFCKELNKGKPAMVFLNSQKR